MLLKATAYTLGWNEKIYYLAREACMNDLGRSPANIGDHFDIHYFNLHESQLQYPNNLNYNILMHISFTQ